MYTWLVRGCAIDHLHNFRQLLKVSHIDGHNMKDETITSVIALVKAKTCFLATQYCHVLRYWIFFVADSGPNLYLIMSVFCVIVDFDGFC